MTTNVTKKEERRELTRQGIIDYCHAKGISRNEFATLANVSTATVSKIENRKWDDISDKLINRIYNKVKTITQVFQTQDCANVFQMCDTSRNKRFMTGLLADTGIGKTTALTAYSGRKNTFYVSYDKSMNPKQFFPQVLKEMAIHFDGSIHAMLNRIADEFNELETPLLIIDEAGKLNHTMILYLQVLRDKTIKNCGIVLAGMPYFKDNLLKNSDKQKEGYAEFFRRINIWHEMEGLSRAEVDFVCSANGITDELVIKEFRSYRRFGDLMNKIILHQTINE